MRFSFTFISLVFLFQVGLAQKQVSQIKKEVFPKEAYDLISDYLENAKRVRFYEERNGSTKSFEAKFKKGRLHYNVNFDGNGDLEAVTFGIEEYDIPQDTWNTINTYLNSQYDKLRIKKILQQHPNKGNNFQKTLHDAFQNLMLPHINYQIIFSARKEEKPQAYEALFNAEGRLVNVREL